MGSSTPKSLQEDLKLTDAEVFWLEKKLEKGQNPAWAGGEQNVVASLAVLKDKLGMTDAEMKTAVMANPLQLSVPLDAVVNKQMKDKKEGGRNMPVETLKKAALVGGLKWLDAQPVGEYTMKDVPAENWKVPDLPELD
jgi:hypothetical protein